jgi:hypothetical protein
LTAEHNEGLGLRMSFLPDEEDDDDDDEGADAADSQSAADADPADMSDDASATGELSGDPTRRLRKGARRAAAAARATDALARTSLLPPGDRWRAWWSSLDAAAVVAHRDVLRPAVADLLLVPLRPSAASSPASAPATLSTRGSGGSHLSVPPSSDDDCASPSSPSSPLPLSASVRPPLSWAVIPEALRAARDLYVGPRPPPLPPQQQLQHLAALGRSPTLTAAVGAGAGGSGVPPSSPVVVSLDPSSSSSSTAAVPAAAPARAPASASWPVAARAAAREYLALELLRAAESCGRRALENGVAPLVASWLRADAAATDAAGASAAGAGAAPSAQALALATAAASLLARLPVEARDELNDVFPAALTPAPLPSPGGTGAGTGAGAGTDAYAAAVPALGAVPTLAPVVVGGGGNGGGFALAPVRVPMAMTLDAPSVVPSASGAAAAAASTAAVAGPAAWSSADAASTPDADVGGGDDDNDDSAWADAGADAGAAKAPLAVSALLRLARRLRTAAPDLATAASDTVERWRVLPATTAELGRGSRPSISVLTGGALPLPLPASTPRSPAALTPSSSSSDSTSPDSASPADLFGSAAEAPDAPGADAGPSVKRARLPGGGADAEDPAHLSPPTSVAAAAAAAANAAAVARSLVSILKKPAGARTRQKRRLVFAPDSELVSERFFNRFDPSAKAAPSAGEPGHPVPATWAGIPIEAVPDALRDEAEAAERVRANA